MGVEWATPRQTDRAHAIMRRIARRTGREVYDLTVDVVDGRIAIRGSTSSYYLKQLAIQAALEEAESWGESPRSDIDVKISVRPTGGQCGMR